MADASESPHVRKMNPEVKKLWVTALRSGDYKQGQGVLRNPDDDTYCCLGVLCDLHRLQTRDGNWSDAGSYCRRAELLPVKVQRWAGLHDDCGSLYNSSLSEANDFGETFEALAEIIEGSF